MIRRIALAVGDTPGHFYPAIAVADSYRLAAPPIDIRLFGPTDGIAARLAAEHGCAYEPIAGSPLARAGAASRIAAGGRSLVGLWQARRALQRHQTKLVIGFGGHASGPVVLAARSLGLRTVIHEGNVEPGLANRWLGRAAHRVYLHFDATGRRFPHDRRLVVGWPVRRELNDLAGVTRSAPGRHRPYRLLVISGRGARTAHFLDREAPRLIAALARRVSIEVRQLIDDDPGAVAGAFEWTDFAIARAGAGTVAELSLAGVPALLVPLADAADDHQALNARAFVDAGGGLWTREADWNAEALADLVERLLLDASAWQRASDGARSVARPDAAGRVVADCEELMQGRW